MKCAVHTEVDSKGFCRDCGKAMCGDCTRDVRGIFYCEECLAGLVSRPQPAAGDPNPAVAALLGLIPGLGAVYNGDFVKAAIHFLIFAALVTVANHDGPQPLTGMMIAGSIIYMSVEAHRTAKAKLLGQTPAMPFSNMGKDQPVGAYLLIGLGALLLLSQVELIPWKLIAEYGIPLAFIALGLLMLRKKITPGS